MTTLTTTPVVDGKFISTWEGIPSPTPLDWIAVYAVGAPYEAFLSWAFVSGTKTPGQVGIESGSLVLDHSTPGEYEARLMANNGHTLLATAPLQTVLESIGGTSYEVLIETIAAEKAEVAAAMKEKDDRIAELEAALGIGTADNLDQAITSGQGVLKPA